MKRGTTRSTKFMWLIAIGAIVFIAILAILMSGKNIAILNPAGSFAQSEYNLIVLTVTVMLIVLVPTMIVLYFFAWRYHESSPHSKRNNPNRKSSKLLLIIFWGLPIATLIILASVMWRDTYKFVPDQVFDTDAKPLEVQVVGLQWKWLFIYPEQNVATVNYVRMPIDRPVHFQLTADDMPMSSFWIPNLGGMLYTMTGHVNRLNLMADTIGQYPGKTAEINGDGYAGMTFTVDVTSQQDFDEWVNKTKQDSSNLSSAEYNRLLEPSTFNSVTYYGSVHSDLYANILAKYEDSHTMSTTKDGDKVMKHGGH